MKKTCALMLSLVLLMAQFVLVVPACAAAGATTAKSGKHSCCAPTKLACNAACCISRNASSSGASAPMAPAPVSARASQFVATLLVALWILPAPDSTTTTADASVLDATSAPSVPLFLRHGTLLI
jgi:hypothetical protein